MWALRFLSTHGNELVRMGGLRWQRRSGISKGTIIGVEGEGELDRGGYACSWMSARLLLCDKGGGVWPTLPHQIIFLEGKNEIHQGARIWRSISGTKTFFCLFFAPPPPGHTKLFLPPPPPRPAKPLKVLGPQRGRNTETKSSQGSQGAAARERTACTQSQGIGADLAVVEGVQLGGMKQGDL